MMLSSESNSIIEIGKSGGNSGEPTAKLPPMDRYDGKASSRSQYIDFMRGVVIFLMLWGHSIQYCIPPGCNFFENSVFKFIYSFHMPMFALISGCLYGLSMNKKGLDACVGGRIVGLAQSIVFGGILSFAIVNLPSAISHRDIRMVISLELLYTSTNFGFLWSILGSAIAVAVAVKLSKSVWCRLLILAAMTPVLFALPSEMLNVYLYPFFILGWLYYEYKDADIVKFLRKMKYLCIPAFIVMLFFYEQKHYIYTTGLFGGANFTDSMKIDVFRYLIGFFGCITALVAGDWIMKLTSTIRPIKRLLVDSLALVGQKSLQVYILSCSLLSFYLPKVANRIYHLGYLQDGVNALLFNAVITPAIALVYTVCLYWIVKAMEKIKVSRLFFGR